MVEDWKNKLYYGDNLDVMREMKINFKRCPTYGTIGVTALFVSMSLIALYVGSKMVEASALLPPTQMDINDVIRLTLVGVILLGAGITTIMYMYSVSNGEQKPDSIVTKE